MNLVLHGPAVALVGMILLLKLSVTTVRYHNFLEASEHEKVRGTKASSRSLITRRVNKAHHEFYQPSQLVRDTTKQDDQQYKDHGSFSITVSHRARSLGSHLEIVIQRQLLQE